MLYLILIVNIYIDIKLKLFKSSLLL